jgi:signal transduction histidine kinase
MRNRMINEKILVVDDDDSHRKAIQFILKEEGYSVIPAQNGAIGLKELKTHDDIRVLIVDLAMREISGVELLKQIKDREHPLRRIVLTAYEKELPFQEAKELDVFSYLNKPISKQTVLFTVKSAFNDLYLKKLEKELGIAKQWEELGQITADFIHLVGNKVGIIPNYIESIEEELKEVPPNVQFKLDRINEISDQINTLKRVLLTPFKKSKIEQVNVNEIIEQTISNINLSRDISLKKYYDLENPVVESNSSELQKVIEDVINNSIDAMKNTEKKELTISTSEGDNETVQITIHDTGCGIKEEEKDKIFRPFYSTMKEESNYGLGLFSAKNTIAKFNGTIKFQSIEGKGTSFLINLPLFKVKKSENKK